MTEIYFKNEDGSMSLNYYVSRFLMRIDELREDIKAMKRIYRTKRTNDLKRKIEFVEDTLTFNIELLKLITHKDILPELIQ